MIIIDQDIMLSDLSVTNKKPENSLTHTFYPFLKFSRDKYIHSLVSIVLGEIIQKNRVIKLQYSSFWD